MRVEPWLQAGKYVTAVASGPARRNGWTIAEQAGDRTPQRTQRLLNRATWDTFAAMGVVRRFAVAGLDEAARRGGRGRGLAVGAIDETSQVKQGTATAGVKRQYLGCVGKVANGITTVWLCQPQVGPLFFFDPAPPFRVRGGWFSFDLAPRVVAGRNWLAGGWM